MLTLEVTSNISRSGLGFNVGWACIVVVSILFLASIFEDVLRLVPILTKTLQPKPKLTHMHHKCTLVYIVQKWIMRYLLSMWYASPHSTSNISNSLDLAICLQIIMILANKTHIQKSSILANKILKHMFYNHPTHFSKQNRFRKAKSCLRNHASLINAPCKFSKIMQTNIDKCLLQLFKNHPIR